MGCASGVLNWIECHQGLAAWVQAVFSVLAIVAAIMLSRLQFRDAQKLQIEQQKVERKRNEEAKRQAEIRWLLALAQVGVRISEIAKQADRASATIESMRFLCQDKFQEILFNEVQASLSLFSLLDAPNDGLIKDLMALKLAMVELKQLMDKIGGLVVLQNPVWQTSAKDISRIVYMAERAYLRIEQAAKDLSDNL